MSGHSLFAHVRDPDERVRSLCEYGCNLEVDASVPPKRYLRSGLEMVRMANVYYEEGDLESAFILYSKFITLYVERLPKHPDYKLTSAHDKAPCKSKLTAVFKNAEDIKQRLKKKFKAQEEKRLEEERKLAEIAAAEAKKREEEALQREKLDDQERQRLQKQKLEEQEQHLRELQEKARREAEERARIQDEQEHAPPSAPSYDGRPPTVDRSSKPDHFTSSGRGTQNRHGYRDVVVPSQLVDKFLAVADANTQKNVETCGILSGKLSQHAFRITHLLIPTQCGGPDSCSTDNEEDVFDYQDQHDLITLGWIHTHPTQTAFMSSVDLHTHCAYQLMMPEAVAIVCAPKFQEVGKFSLTADYGLRFIANCRQPGFHPHPKDPPLYEEGEHVKMDERADCVLADLRKGSQRISSNTRI